MNKSKRRKAVPNIEIHGISHVGALTLTHRIHNLFKDRRYADDVVVTINSTQVFDRHMTGQPFLRLITTNSDQESAEIIELLQTLEMDIEYIVAAGFYPKQIQVAAKPGI